MGYNHIMSIGMRPKNSIDKGGRYALRIMLDLAVHDSGECGAAEGNCSQAEYTLKYMEQITPLSKAGFVQSLRGFQRRIPSCQETGGIYCGRYPLRVLGGISVPETPALKGRRIPVPERISARRFPSGKVLIRLLTTMLTVSRWRIL